MLETVYCEECCQLALIEWIGKLEIISPQGKHDFCTRDEAQIYLWSNNCWHVESCAEHLTVIHGAGADNKLIAREFDESD